MNAEEIEEVRSRLKPLKPNRRSLVRAGVMLAPAELARLDQAATAEGKSRSALIREAVRKMLRRR